jgi:hypothetical protein
MERVASREWTPDQQTRWFYERARGSYQTAKSREASTPAKRKDFEKRYPANQRFTKEDLAKFENAWLGLPHIVSRGSQKNFDYFIHHCLPATSDGWEPSIVEYRRYIAKGILFRETQRIVRKSEECSGYPINVVAYTIALIAEKTARRIDLDRIWRDQSLTPALANAIEEVAPKVAARLPDLSMRNGTNTGESFKKVECWEHIRSMQFTPTKSLDKEMLAVGDNSHSSGVLVGSQRSGGLTSEDQNNIAACMQLGEKDWLSIARWGQESGTLNDVQRGISRTLAGYAAESWSKIPSYKQAKQGKKMIDDARRAGIIR